MEAACGGVPANAEAVTFSLGPHYFGFLPHSTFVSATRARASVCLKIELLNILVVIGHEVENRELNFRQLHHDT